MTKEEIKALVSAKIAGQGSMVDIGGALPEILSATVDAIPEGGGEPYVVQGATLNDTDYEKSVLEVSEEEFARAKAAFLSARICFIPTVGRCAYFVTGYSEVATLDGPEGLSLWCEVSSDANIGVANALIPKKN